MSFRIEDLMVQVLPRDPDGRSEGDLEMCDDTTRSGDEGKECSDNTRASGGTGGTKKAEAELALLRAQLRQALESRV